MRMQGFILFQKAGRYTFQARSNDGIKVLIGNEMIVNDPEVHADRYSDQIPLNIPAPGWYPLTVEYFQRKGTAATELYWKGPDMKAFAIIPAEAYAHSDPLSPGQNKEF